MRVFLTGGTGLLGRYFAELAVAQGAELVALARPASHTAHLEALDVTIHTGDLQDVASLAAGMKGCEAVVHLASPKGGWRAAPIFEQDIVQGTVNVLAAMKEVGVQCLVYASSIAVHGLDPTKGSPISEASGFGQHFFPYDFYGRAKIQAEESVAAAHQAGYIRATVIRPGWFYGPYDTAGYGRLAARLKQRLLFKIGSGQNLLPMVYVGNVADIIWLCLREQSTAYRVYLYAADGPVTQNDYLASLARAARTTSKPIALPKGIGLALAAIQETASVWTGYKLPTLQTRQFVALWGSDWSFDQRLLAEELGYRPRVSYKAGLAATEEWYRTYTRQRPQ